MPQTIDAALREHVTGLPEFAALAGVKFFKDHAPQGTTLPYAVYERIGTERDVSLDGGLRHPAARYQITCWGSTGKEASDLALTITDALDGVRVTMGEFSDVVAFIDDELSGFDLSPHGDDAGDHSEIVYVLLHYHEA